MKLGSIYRKIEHNFYTLMNQHLIKFAIRLIQNSNNSNLTSAKAGSGSRRKTQKKAREKQEKAKITASQKTSQRQRRQKHTSDEESQKHETRTTFAVNDFTQPGLASPQKIEFNC
jgi:transcription initiation factor IIF auxiliary subunit